MKDITPPTNMKTGEIATQVLVVLIIIVFTSAVVLVLLKTGVLEQTTSEQHELLDSQFIPGERSGFISIKQLDFCGEINENFDCIGEDIKFLPGQDIFVRFLVDTDTAGGQIVLARNYRITSPTGTIVLEAEQSNQFDFTTSISKNREVVAFADSYTAPEDFVEGKYTLEVIVENPLLGKKVTASKNFEMYIFQENDYYEVEG